MAATGGGEAAATAAGLQAAGLQAAGLQLQAEGVEDLPVEAVVEALQLQVRYLVITPRGWWRRCSGRSGRHQPRPWGYLALPHLAPPRLTSPHLTWPHLTSPSLVLP